MDDIDRFLRIFDGRRDAFGGGAAAHCEWVDPSTDDIHSRFDAHLNGNRPTGVYPLRPDLSARWGCIDVDEDNLALVQELYRELLKLHTKPFVEISRSKGWHLWWFYGRWVPGWVPRSVGLEAAHRAGVGDIEVYPKQFTLTDGSPGNYVRLPYPAGSARTQRQVMMLDGEFVDLATFLVEVRFTDAERHRREALRSPLCPLELALGIKFPPFPGGGSTGHQTASRKLWQEAAQAVLAERVIPMGQRDNQLFTCANLMWALGWTQDRAMDRITEIHEKQLEQGGGKQHYPLRAAQDKVRRVYAQRGERNLPAFGQARSEPGHGKKQPAQGGQLGAGPGGVPRKGGATLVPLAVTWER